MYMFYLICMSLAFFLKAENNDRSQYNTSTDYARGFFEVVTFLVACIYAILEIVEIIKYDCL